jgi:hypothetical protein
VSVVLRNVLKLGSSLFVRHFGSFGGWIKAKLLVSGRQTERLVDSNTADKLLSDKTLHIPSRIVWRACRV